MHYINKPKPPTKPELYHVLYVQPFNRSFLKPCSIILPPLNLELHRTSRTCSLLCCNLQVSDEWLQESRCYLLSLPIARYEQFAPAKGNLVPNSENNLQKGQDSESAILTSSVSERAGTLHVQEQCQSPSLYVKKPPPPQPATTLSVPLRQLQTLNTHPPEYETRLKF